MAPSKTFIIAECGINHNGVFDTAVAQIAHAKKAGADAVKFQMYDPKEQAKGVQDQTIVDALDECHISTADMVRLKEMADCIGIEFMCTPFQWKYVDFVDKLVKRHKIGSGQVKGGFGLVGAAAATEKPLIISTGMVDDDELQNALAGAKHPLTGKDPDITLLYCVSKYPTPDHNINFGRMKDLADKFGRSVGFSDHTVGIFASVAAVANGASVIEKHFTTDRSLGGPDQVCSLEPHEFAVMVREIRRL